MHSCVHRVHFVVMAPLKCCVGGCDATSASHRLFCVPKNDYLRRLWMRFLVPTNPSLLGLSKDQLINRRVCEKHFRKQSFYPEGKRLRFSYPCLYTEDEIARGEPVSVHGEDLKQAFPGDEDFDDTRQSKDESDVNEAFADDEDFDDTRQLKDESDLIGDCTDIEYLEEDEAADSDDSTDMKRRQDTYTLSKMMFEQDFKLTLDEIDFLFLSYAKTFRSLAKQLQTMLKLDIAKLFTRYEQKNASLGPQDPSKPAESPTPSEENQPSVLPETAPLKPLPPDLVSPQPEVNLAPEKPFVFSNEENKRTYRRVPLQEVPSEVIKVAQAQVAQAQVAQTQEAQIQVAQAHVAQAKPAAATPDVTIMRLPGSCIRAAIPGDSGRKLLFLSPQAKILRPPTKPKVIVQPATGDVTNLNPTVELERIHISSRVQDALSADSTYKFVLPKKGPAYVIMSKKFVDEELDEEERELEKAAEELEEEDPSDHDLEMEVQTYSDVAT